MENQFRQADLFEIHASKSHPGENHGVGPSFLERYYIRIRIDQLLFAVIVIIGLNAFFFGQGVEKGRQGNRKELTGLRAQLKAAATVVATETEVMPEIAKATAVSEVAPASPARDAAPVEDQDPAGQAQDASLKGKYTIQLVTYLTQSAAEKQVKALEAKGLQGFTVTRGTYILVCVNAFASRSEAQKTLLDLKSRGIAPQDAYIRSMPA